MKGLTEIQGKILDFLKAYTGNHGYPPTVREIGERFKIFWPAARKHLQSLERKGFVRLNPTRSRGIEIVGFQFSGERSIPVVGRIRAGEPTVAIEEINSHIRIDSSLFPAEDTFSLRVVGDSMRDAGILNGDFVIVKPQSTVVHGEIGVILIGDEATVKRVIFKDELVMLKPENKDMEPMIYRPEEVSIIGKVIGLLRNRI
ncbi:MAG: transcriptional repressor LexA [Syntrophorhabdus sp.]